MLGRAKVQLDGKYLERSKEKGSPFLVRDKEGNIRQLRIKAHFFDPVPVILLDQEEILLAERLRVIDCLLAILPIGMFIGRGPLPTLIGYFVITANFRILRTRLSPTVKWVAVYALSLAVFYLTVTLANFIWSTK